MNHVTIDVSTGIRCVPDLVYHVADSVEQLTEEKVSEKAGVSVFSAAQ